ncbi:MAG TPA: alginate lyase family protein [Rhodoferax sp.]
MKPPFKNLVGLMSFAAALVLGTASAVAQPFVHPGALHSQADFERMRTKVAQGAQPWGAGWGVLTSNSHASLKWTPHPQEVVYRGKDGTHPENYGTFYNDIAAAYALALRWKVSGDEAYADKAVEILNAWSEKLTGIGGNSDRFLASGLYGYELSNAAEIMRTYKKWSANDFNRFKTMMVDVFYPMNHDFLVRHNGAKIDHYWANWDLANMNAMISIGILADRRDIYTEAVEYFKHGAGNGAIEHAVWKLYPEGLGQTQESGRDQGHNDLNVSLLGTFCQMSWNQHDDLFGYQDNRVLKGVEYVAKYNLGLDVPYTTYVNSDVTQDHIADAGRGDIRPAWELVYNHYVVLKGLEAPDTSQYAEKLRPEGGGGNYGPNSGGFDQLGYGTLTFTLK